MGGLWRPMPVTAITFILGSVAMAGIPPLSGFWSKEEILVAVSHSLPPAFLALVFIVSGMTAFYISRAVILTFFGTAKDSHAHPHESPWVMTIPLAILSIGAVGVGLLGSRWTGHAFQHFLGIHAGAHEGGQTLQQISIAVAGTGILLALARYGFGWQLLPVFARRTLSPFYRLAAGKYFVDEIYGALLIRPVQAAARKAFSFDAKVVDGAVNGAGSAGLAASRVKRWIDEHWVDGAVNGLGITVGRVGAAFRQLQTGLVQNYLMIAFGSAVALFLLWKGMLR